MLTGTCFIDLRIDAFKTAENTVIQLTTRDRVAEECITERGKCSDYVNEWKH